MYKPISIFIALRYLWNPHLPQFKKIITFLSIIGISISTASLIIIISIINGSEENFRKNILSFIPHLIITNKNHYINKSEFPRHILKIKNFEKFSDFINQEVIIKSNNDISIAEIIGVDNTNYDNISNYHVENVLNLLKAKQHNVIIGKKLASKLNIHIGDEIKLIILSNNKNFFSGKIFNENKFKVINFFSTQHEVDYYQVLMNKEDSLNFFHFSKNYITGWRIWLKEPLYCDFHKIKKKLNNFVLLNWKLYKGEFFKAMKIEKYVMLFLFSLILIISIFNIFINLTIYVEEKQKSIAMLKLQGLVNYKIMLIFVIIGSSTAIIGNILGTIFSIALIMQHDLLKYFINLFFNEINIPIIIIPSQIIFINMTSILISIIATVYPAWHAIQLKPSKIFYNE